MDITPEIAETLSYDDTTPYDQLPAPSPTEPGHAQLASRIGNTKVYLLSETTGTRSGKRKHVDTAEGEDPEGDVEMDEETSYRDNAILLQGAPISHLPTQRIFAYATHFDAHPLALEWIDDTTCVLVFPSKADARSAHRLLTKSIAEEPSLEDSSVTAKPVPITLWPPEDRINKSLGKGEGLKGVIRMRWATRQDVKKKGAKRESEFYKKYGTKAGKVGEDGERDDGRERKRRRGGELEDRVEKGRLDEELDSFLSGGERPASPPSRMHSDNMRSHKKSLLERTSAAPTRSLASRLIADLPRRARSPRRGRRDQPEGQRTERERGLPRPRKTQAELDAELDAFLDSRG